MLVSGVRSSWLTIERKSSLIRCRRLLARHALLEVGPQLRVLERRPRALRDRLGHAPDALLERPIAAPARGEHAVQPPAGKDRDGHEPIDAQRAHPVRIAGLDLGGGGLRVAAVAADAADQPIAEPQVTALGKRAPRVDQLPVRAGGGRGVRGVARHRRS